MKPTGQLVRKADVTSRERDEMFALMQSYYEGIERETFEADLDEKDWVIRILDQDTNQCKGFSTQMLLSVEIAGRTIQALFSGDTIVDSDVRGERSLLQVSGWFVRSLMTTYPGEELYWFLISKGYKTYRFLPLFFHEFYPRYDAATPARYADVINALARSKFPLAYDGERGIVKAGPCGCRLRTGIADITPDRIRDPHVRFFAERNPRHALGDELCCIAPLTPGNLTPVAHRAMGSRPRLQIALS